MKKKTVAYYPGDKSVIFALSAFMRAGYSLYPVWKMSDLWDIGTQRLALLDLENNENFADLETFICTNAWKIDFKTSLQHLYGNEQRETDHPLISTLRRYSSKEFRSVDEAAMLNSDIIPPQQDLLRHYCALRASSIKAANTDDPTFYTRTLESISREIASDSCYSDIDLLANFYQRVEMSTEAAFAKVSTNQDIFNIPGRTVAYGYLSNISPWLDLESLQKRSRKSFPYLTIIQYRKKEREITWIGSDSMLDLELFFDLPNNGKHEMLLEGSHRYVTRLLKSKILEITSQ